MSKFKDEAISGIRGGLVVALLYGAIIELTDVAFAALRWFLLSLALVLGAGGGALLVYETHENLQHPGASPASAPTLIG